METTEDARNRGLHGGTLSRLNNLVIKISSGAPTMPALKEACIFLERYSEI